MTDKSPSDGFTLEELRSEFDWMFEFQSRMAEYIRNDHDVHSLAGYVSKLEEQNAKLREMASLVSEYISHDRCEGCVIKTACNSYELDECWMTTKLRNQLRDLGVEVDE